MFYGGSHVSISESRNFSFQGKRYTPTFYKVCYPVSISESRNFSFQADKWVYSEYVKGVRFNLGIEKLFFSSRIIAYLHLRKQMVSISESRNFSFQGKRAKFTRLSKYEFQSRNRETFLFKCQCIGTQRHGVDRFNLGIEKLFFSRGKIFFDMTILDQVSISESRKLFFSSYQI